MLCKKSRYVRRAEATTNSLRQASSKRFADWFAGSVVLDGAGSPLRVFHGTCDLFNCFRPFSHFSTALAADVGVWRSRKKKGFQPLFPAELDMYHYLHCQDEIRGNVSAGHHYPVYLRLCRPITIRDDGEDHSLMDLIDEAKDAGALSMCDMRAIFRALNVSPSQGENEFVRRLLAAGIDGFRYVAMNEDPGQASWVNISPRQVRSIFAPDHSMHM